MKPIGPQPGAQTRFAACPADICVFGGGAGGGKSEAVVYEPLKWIHIPGFAGVLFRRDTTQITGPGSLWEKAQKLYPPTGATLVQSPTLVARWDTETTTDGRTGAEIHFRHLQHEWTVQDHDGKEYAFVGIDEGQYFTGDMIWYMWGRCRTLCGVKPYMRITCNPDPDCYLRTLIDWWIGEDGYPIPERDGVLRWVIRLGDEMVWFDTEAEALAHVKEIQAASGGTENAEIDHLAPISVTFIRSKLTDNPALLAHDPTYGARLAMQSADDRAKKLGGNWNARTKPGEMFDPAWFGVLDAPPKEADIAFKVRGWDKAATLPSDRNKDPDWTRGVLSYLLKNGNVVIADIVSLRDTPGKVDALVRSTAERDGPTVTQAFWQDGGQAGVVDKEHTEALLRPVACGPVSFEPEIKSKIHYAKDWSAFANPACNHGQRRMWIVRGAWNKDFYTEIRTFPKPRGEAGKAVHDDIVDAMSRAWKSIATRIGGAARFLQAMRVAGR